MHALTPLWLSIGRLSGLGMKLDRDSEGERLLLENDLLHNTDCELSLGYESHVCAVKLDFLHLILIPPCIDKILFKFYW